MGKAFRWMAVMLMAWAFIGVAFAQSLSDVQVYPDIDVIPDRFHPGDVMVRTSPKTMNYAWGQPDLMWAANISNGTLRSITVIISVHNAEWQYLNCNTVDWLLDGQPVQLPAFVYAGKVTTPGVIEYLTTNLTINQIVGIMRANKQEYRICTSEFALTEPQRFLLAHFGQTLANQLHHAN